MSDETKAALTKLVGANETNIAKALDIAVMQDEREIELLEE